MKKRISYEKMQKKFSRTNVQCRSLLLSFSSLGTHNFISKFNCLRCFPHIMHP